MSGLSYFDEGGQAEQQDVSVQVKPVAGRGAYNLGTPVSNIAMNSGVLSTMERLYQERLAQQGGFMEGMKDAAAWWSGGVEGPSAGLSRRTQEREKQSENLFQLQTQIAQFKAAQEAQKAFERRRGNELGLGGGAQGAAPTGAAQSMFGMPPEIRQALLNAKTEADYNKIYTEWAKKKAEVEASPEFDVPKISVVTWDEEQGDWVLKKISARQLRANPNKYFNEDGTPATEAPTQAAPAPAAPAAPTEAAPVSGDLTAEDRAIPPAATPAAPVAASAKAPVNYTYDELTPEQIQMMSAKGASMGLIRDVTSSPEVADFFNKQPLEKRKQVFDALAPEQTKVAAAPGATTTDVTAPSVGAMRPPQVAAPVAPAPAPAPAKRPPRPTAGQLERKAEVEKELDVAAGRQTLESDKIERDKFLSEANPTRVSERKVRAKRVQDLVLQDPTIVGVLTQPNVKSAIAKVLQEGVSTPSGSVGIKGISDAIFQTLPTTLSTAKRREIAGYIAQMELDASQAMNGQGQISDGEREIIRAASISIEDPAEVVYKKAKMMEARQDTLQKLKSLYGDGRKYAKSFVGFQSSPEYLKISEAYEEQLRKIANEDVKIDRSMVGKTQGPKNQKGAKPSNQLTYEDAEKESRYQEWKRSQSR